ncbi:hypothetical protein C0081_00735 [Cohaesibacter celericrescens]|uniref:Uncharacterized protein n=1 Tax=Cohaesibacter celericrescens TaxID=2067669 RepID=A0A2N5XWK5_9HYPH|nr:hypothetical protein C0081_00735 [Cohaesibacter celericrescens]
MTHQSSLTLTKDTEPFALVQRQFGATASQQIMICWQYLKTCLLAVLTVHLRRVYHFATSPAGFQQLVIKTFVQSKL